MMLKLQTRVVASCFVWVVELNVLKGSLKNTKGIHGESKHNASSSTSIGIGN